MKIYILGILIILNNGCQTLNPKEAYLMDYLSDYKDIVGKKIVLESYLFYQIFPKDAQINYSSKNILVSIIGTSCITCIESIKDWTNLLDKKEFANVQLLLIAIGKSSPDLEYYIHSENKHKIPILLDTTGAFIEKNQLQNYTRSSFLLNKEKEVLMIGNPIKDNTIYEYYIHILNNDKKQ